MDALKFRYNTRMATIDSPFHYTKNKRKQAAPEASVCDWPGCKELGEHPAPAGRVFPESFLARHPHLKDKQANERYGFCLRHVRIYNKNWNFFDGMHSAHVTAFERDALTGHRKTYKVNDLGKKYQKFTEAGYKKAESFRGDHHDFKSEPAATPVAEEKKALDIIGVTLPLTLQELKVAYRKLVKTHHPDIKQTKEAEEHFKTINWAYHYLKARHFA